MSDTTDPKGLRYFHGDGSQGSHQELRKWIKWARSAMACRKLEREQRGPFIYTLLQGSALEVVDHLEFEDYECEDGDGQLLQLLEKRWPAKEQEDVLGEHLEAVFGLQGREGEHVTAWLGRSKE
eukprot:1208057-Pyramimonas_sp.AAC.1